jgi:hypothetical protein
MPPSCPMKGAPFDSDDRGGGGNGELIGINLHKGILVPYSRNLDTES